MEDPVVSNPLGQITSTIARPAEEARFEPLGLLGEGGMGRVDRVRDRDLLREVAVKHLRPEPGADRARIDQLLWEARVTAYLDHPNIVPVHDLGEGEGGRLYFTMKLVRGRSLEAVIAEQSENANTGRPVLSLSRRLGMFLQVCHAVSFAHARGVLHRHLKPAHIFTGEHGEVLVTDWGTAVPVAGERGEALRSWLPAHLLTQPAGTPMYMSPEQSRGDALDARSDIFTLGSILYELCALQSAFEAESLPEVLRLVERAEKEPLSEIAPELPPALVAVIDRAMARSPGDRYASVLELVEDVETVLDGRALKARRRLAVRKPSRHYIAENPGMAKLRVSDIQSWMSGTGNIGVGIGLMIGPSAARIDWLGWMVIAVGIGWMITPTWRWLNNRRKS